jgi:hypothetical protein
MDLNRETILSLHCVRALVEVLFTQNTYTNLPQLTIIFLSVTRGIIADVSFRLVHSQVLRTKTIRGLHVFVPCIVIQLYNVDQQNALFKLMF